MPLALDGRCWSAGPNGRRWALEYQPKAGTGWHWGAGVPGTGWNRALECQPSAGTCWNWALGVSCITAPQQYHYLCPVVCVQANPKKLHDE